MKDIYELLNHVEIDNEEIPEIDVSEIEKEKVKRNLNKHLRKRKYKKSGLIAAAICCAFIGGIGTIGIINPAYASDIPVIGDIFRFLDDKKSGIYDRYNEKSNKINMEKECNGIKVTIKEAVFEDNSIIYTYEIESDRDLGENPNITGLEVKGYEDESNGECSFAHRVKDNVYVGQAISIYDDGIKEDNIKCKININSIPIINQNTAERVKGEWSFDFNLKRIEGNNEIIDKSVENDGMTCKIDSIYKTPISVIIRHSVKFDDFILDKLIDRSASIKEWTRDEARIKVSIESTIDVKDDLGNVYNVDPFEGYSADTDSPETFSTLTNSHILSSINENASKLIITPKIRFRDNDEITFADKDDDMFFNGDDLKGKEIIFDDIIIELK